MRRLILIGALALAAALAGCGPGSNYGGRGSTGSDSAGNLTGGGVLITSTPGAISKVGQATEGTPTPQAAP